MGGGTVSDQVFLLPDLGEGLTEAEIVAWHVKVGDVVSEDQIVADVMTDKATVEITAPVSGRIGLRQGSASNLQLALNRFRIIDNDLAEARGSGTLTAASGPAPKSRYVSGRPCSTRAASQLWVSPSCCRAVGAWRKPSALTGSRTEPKLRVKGAFFMRIF